MSQRYPSWTAAQLRRDLNARAERIAREHGLLHDLSTGAEPSVIFGRDEQGRHGNFHPESYAALCADPDWRPRLEKVHTASRRSRARKDWRWMELDSATSSDALLMNIFCHPQVYDGERLAPQIASVLGVDPATKPRFGIEPGVPLFPGRVRNRHAVQQVDRTEIDLVLGDLLVEAKLTESGFQTAPLSKLQRYRDLERVFDLDRLPRRITHPAPLPENVDSDDPTVNLPRRAVSIRVDGYQLIRNVLAAYGSDASFCVLCDARRHDLMETWFQVQTAVHAPDFRWRLKLLTWQEVAAALPDPMQHFLAEKYGIAS